MPIGYARVSTDDQDTAAQAAALKATGCERVFREKASGGRWDLADRIKAAMAKDRLTKAAMAIRMQTSRRALDRLPDPSNTSVTLHTLQRVAVAIGRQLRLELI